MAFRRSGRRSYGGRRRVSRASRMKRRISRYRVSRGGIRL